MLSINLEKEFFQMETKIERFKRTTPPKCIRTYQRVAYKSHRCWRCPHPISPGDEYIGEVWVGKDKGRKYIQVSKNHSVCPGDRYDYEEEPELEEDKTTSEELSKAA